MKATWEKIDKNIVSIDVEVEAEKVAEALDQAFKKVVQKVNVPGFRKGKVPRGIFESRFGIESLYQDAIDILLAGCLFRCSKRNIILSRLTVLRLMLSNSQKAKLSNSKQKLSLSLK